MTRLNRFREKVNLKLYDSKLNVLKWLKIMSFFIALIITSLLVYYHGYPLSAHEKEYIQGAVYFSFIFYIIKYIVKFIYSFQPLQFLRDTKVEGLIILFLFLNISSIFIFNFNIYTFLANKYNIVFLEDFFNLLIQAYILVIIALEMGKAFPLINQLKISPPLIFIIVLFLLILVGTILLLMPNMSNIEGSSSFLSALFTAVSASTITGLAVVDTATYWTIKGQIVILFLIQLGALNVVSFASLLLLFSRSSMGIRQQSMMQSNLNTESLASSRGLISKIIFYTLFIEGLGFILISSTLYSQKDFNLEHSYFHALFHSISAFNNAGFSTIQNGLAHEALADNYLFFLIVSIIIIFGSLGFSNIQDIFSIASIKERMNKPWIHLKINTRVAIFTNSILIILGIIVFYVFERNTSFYSFDELGKWVHALFQSVTTRSAGFNSIDFGDLHTSVLIVVILFMFIGGSSGSTAGGIKTNTFTLIMVSIYNTIRGREVLHIYNRTISHSLVLKAISILMFYLSSISLSIFLVCITDNQYSLLQVSFEVVSAYCTTGLSMGITGDLSQSGKIILMVGMFIGRIGPLTMAYALLKPAKSKNYSYPKAVLAIG